MIKIALAFLFLFQFICQTKGQTISVKGNIEGLIDSTTLKVSVLPLRLGEDAIYFEAECKNGSFSFSENLIIPMWHLVRIDCDQFFRSKSLACEDGINHDIYFFVFPGDAIHIEAEKLKYGVRFTSIGNSIGQQQSKVFEKTFQLEHSIVELIEQKGELLISPEIDERIIELKRELERVKLEFIDNNLDLEISAIMLPEFNPDIILQKYPMFSPEVKESFFGKYVEDLILLINDNFEIGVD